MIPVVLVAHALGALFWSVSWGMHCGDSKKSYAELACGVSLLIVAWGPERCRPRLPAAES